MPATTRQATIGTQNVPLREQADYLTEPIDPCTPIANSTKEPCQPDSYWLTAVTGGTGLGPNWDEEPTTIREQLDGTSILSVPHIVLRGTYIPDTARCQSPIKIRTPRYADPDFYPYSDEMRVIHCYADVRVNEYMVGTGPPTLTLMVTTSHYWKSVFLDYAAREREAGRNPPPLEEMEEKLRKIDETILIHGYDPLGSDPGRQGQGIHGREYILFIGPARNHATEVWDVFTTWSVQRLDNGMISAIHPRRGFWATSRQDAYPTQRTALEMYIPVFAKAVKKANEERVADFGGRLAADNIPSRADGVELPMLLTDANSLTQFYRATGAYDHPDGPPAQPPPPSGPSQ